MIAAEGILTSRGGVSSRRTRCSSDEQGLFCGAAEVVINYGKETLKIGKKTFKSGDDISIDGTTGEIFAGAGHRPSEVDHAKR